MTESDPTTMLGLVLILIALIPILVVGVWVLTVIT